MNPRINVVTLAVADLARALAFYRDTLGLDSPGVTGTQFPGDDTHPAGAVVMFQLDGELTLALYPRSELAKDAEIAPGPAQSGEFSLGIFVATRADVDTILARAETAGATVTPPHDRPWASTPATSATSTDTSGRSSTTQTDRSGSNRSGAPARPRLHRTAQPTLGHSGGTRISCVF